MASDSEASCTSDPNFAVICSFLEKFGASCGITSPDFLELQEMLENTQEVSPELIDLHIKLLRKIRRLVQIERWEKGLINLCHLYNSQDAWEIERFGYKKARLSSKLRILKTLLEMQFDYNAKFKTEVNRLTAKELRTEPIGRDKHGHIYWYQMDENCEMRIYKEDPDEETWDLVVKDREGLVRIISQLASDDPNLADVMLNEDSNSLEIEKPIIDTGQNTSPSTSNCDAEADESSLGNDDSKDVSSEVQTETSTNDLSHSDEKSETTTEPIVEKLKISLNMNNSMHNNQLEVHKEDQLNVGVDLTMSHINSEQMKGVDLSNKKKRSINELAADLRSRTNEQIYKNPVQEQEMDLSIKKSRIDTQFSSLSVPPYEVLSFENAFNMSGDMDSEEDMEDEEDELDESDEIELPSHMTLPRQDRPKLLHNPKKKSYSEEEEEYGEEIEEPLMLVQGEGSGRDCQDGNSRECEFSEVVEESVMYFYGEGSGYDCDTGNTKKEEDSNLSNSNSQQSNDSECSSSVEEKSDVIYATEVNPKSNKIGKVMIDVKSSSKVGTTEFNSVKKCSRWDIGKPNDEILQTDDSTNSINVNENEPALKNTKKPMFFFGPGCFQFKAPMAPYTPDVKDYNVKNVELTKISSDELDNKSTEIIFSSENVPTNVQKSDILIESKAEIFLSQNELLDSTNSVSLDNDKVSNLSKLLEKTEGDNIVGNSEKIDNSTISKICQQEDVSVKKLEDSVNSSQIELTHSSCEKSSVQISLENEKLTIVESKQNENKSINKESENIIDTTEDKNKKEISSDLLINIESENSETNNEIVTNECLINSTDIYDQEHLTNTDSTINKDTKKDVFQEKNKENRVNVEENLENQFVSNKTDDTEMNESKIEDIVETKLEPETNFSNISDKDKNNELINDISVETSLVLDKENEDDLIKQEITESHVQSNNDDNKNEKIELKDEAKIEKTEQHIAEIELITKEKLLTNESNIEEKENETIVTPEIETEVKHNLSNEIIDKKNKNTEDIKSKNLKDIKQSTDDLLKNEDITEKLDLVTDNALDETTDNEENDLDLTRNQTNKTVNFPSNETSQLHIKNELEENISEIELKDANIANKNEKVVDETELKINENLNVECEITKTSLSIKLTENEEQNVNVNEEQNVNVECEVVKTSLSIKLTENEEHSKENESEIEISQKELAISVKEPNEICELKESEKDKIEVTPESDIKENEITELKSVEECESNKLETISDENENRDLKFNKLEHSENLDTSTKFKETDIKENITPIIEEKQIEKHENKDLEVVFNVENNDTNIICENEENKELNISDKCDTMYPITEDNKLESDVKLDENKVKVNEESTLENTDKLCFEDEKKINEVITSKTESNESKIDENKVTEISTLENTDKLCFEDEEKIKELDENNLENTYNFQSNEDDEKLMEIITSKTESDESKVEVNDISNLENTDNFQSNKDDEKLKEVITSKTESNENINDISNLENTDNFQSNKDEEKFKEVITSKIQSDESKEVNKIRLSENTAKLCFEDKEKIKESSSKTESDENKIEVNEIKHLENTDNLCFEDEVKIKEVITSKTETINDTEGLVIKEINKFEENTTCKKDENDCCDNIENNETQKIIMNDINAMVSNDNKPELSTKLDDNFKNQEQNLIEHVFNDTSEIKECELTGKFEIKNDIFSEKQNFEEQKLSMSFVDNTSNVQKSSIDNILEETVNKKQDELTKEYQLKEINTEKNEIFADTVEKLAIIDNINEKPNLEFIENEEKCQSKHIMEPVEENLEVQNVEKSFEKEVIKEKKELKDVEETQLESIQILNEKNFSNVNSILDIPKNKTELPQIKESLDVIVQNVCVKVTEMDLPKSMYESCLFKQESNEILETINKEVNELHKVEELKNLVKEENSTEKASDLSSKPEISSSTDIVKLEADKDLQKDSLEKIEQKEVESVKTDFNNDIITQEAKDSSSDEDYEDTFAPEQHFTDEENEENKYKSEEQNATDEKVTIKNAEEINDKEKNEITSESDQNIPEEKESDIKDDNIKPPELICVDVDKLQEKSVSSDLKQVISLDHEESNDIIHLPETDPLACSDEELCKTEEKTVTEEPQGLSLANFKLDGTDDNDNSDLIPEPIARALRNRKICIEAANLKRKRGKEIDNSGGKKRKALGKKPGNIGDRLLSTEKEDGDSTEDDNKNENQQTVIPNRGKGKRGRARGRGRSFGRLSNDSPVLSSDPLSETSRNEETANVPVVEKKVKKRRLLMGLEIDPSVIIKADEEENTDETSTRGSIRQSRRIAQLKIKEEAERRKHEELTSMELLEKTKKKKSKKNKDKDFTIGKKNDSYIEDESDEEEEEETKHKKKIKQKDFAKLFNVAKPWESSSNSSSSNEEEEEEEVEEEVTEVEVSDHEFSPESDLEDSNEVQPLRRARTVKKESDTEDPTDEHACQKCGKADHPEWILLCDKCDCGWHCSCLRPALLVIPEGDWFCPPCQHTSLIEALKSKLLDYDKRVNRREMEVRRKQRLAYVGISLDNVLSTKEHEVDKEKEEDDKEEMESDNGSRGSSDSESSESGSESSSEEESDEPIYQLRERRQAHSYRFNDYDELINSAIQDEMESVKGAGNQGRGKDIATIVNAEKEEAKNQALLEQHLQQQEDQEQQQQEQLQQQQQQQQQQQEELEPEMPPPVVPVYEEKVEQEAYDEYSDDDEPRTRKLIGRKKHRKLNSLDVSSDDDPDDDEDFKGTSASEEEDLEDLPSDDSDELDFGRRGKGRGGPTRRSTRARTSRYDKDFINDDSDDDPPPRFKRSIWDETESEESDKSWGKRKRRKKQRGNSSNPRPSKKSRKKRRRNDDSDPEVKKFVKKPKIKFGGLENSDDELLTRRTRGKKINYIDALGSDSEEEKVKVKPIESEEEYVANEDDDEPDDVLDPEEEKESDSDTDQNHGTFGKKVIKIIAPQKVKGRGKAGIPRPQHLKQVSSSSMLPIPPEAESKFLEQNFSSFDNVGESSIPVNIPVIAANPEDLNEDEVGTMMMENEEYAKKQLELMAIQLAKEKKRKEMEIKTLEPSAEPKKRGRKKKSEIEANKLTMLEQQMLDPNEKLLPVNSELDYPNVPTVVSDMSTNPMKRRGRGKGKKTLAAEAAAAGVPLPDSSPASIGSPIQPQELSNIPPSSVLPRVSTPDTNLMAGKLGIAAPPQPFSQNQPAPSVITRMLQSQPISAQTYTTNSLNQKYFPTGCDQPPRGPFPAASGRGRVPSPYRQSPPTMAMYRPVASNSPHRLRSPGPPNMQMFHSPHHPMDPSPSGGGPINMPANRDRNSPTVAKDGPTPPPPPYSRAIAMNRFSPNENSPGPSLPPSVRHHIFTQSSPPPRPPPGNFSPYHPPPPPNYHYGAYPPPPALAAADDALPPTDYQGSPYPEHYNPVDGTVHSSEGSNSKPFDEEGSGEFGGLVSYFSSQREDDLDT